ncbi:MAG: PKD domain-containing protein, partial [Flavisolibacter sp.]
IYGCKDTITKVNYIRINGPTANFTANRVSGCTGSNLIFNDLSQDDGISPIISWKFDFGDSTGVQTFTGPPFEHIYSKADTFSVRLTVTDAGGCYDFMYRPNYIRTTTTKANFIADTLSCPGSPVALSNRSIWDGIPQSVFWDLGDGNTSNDLSVFHHYADTGIYTIKLVITDAVGCTDSITKPNHIRISRPYASFTMSDSISSCTPFEVQFTNTSKYLYSSVWDLGGGMSTLKDPVQFYNSPGIYPIKLLAMSPGGCLDSAFGTVRVFDTTGSRITYTPLDGCKPLLVDLNTFSPGPMSYTWDFGDGILISNDSTNMSHVYNFFGDFIPKVIMTDPAGCIIPVTGKDTINIKGATVKFGFDKKLFCDSGLVYFIDSTVFNDSLSVYNWDFGDGNISHLQNPSHYYSSPGNYDVMLNVQTQNACVDTFRIRTAVKVVASPLISIGGDSVICIHDYMQHLGVFNRPDTSAIRWTWEFPNNSTAGVQNPLKQQYNTAGNFLVKTVALNSSGCVDSATKNITINALPTVNVPPMLSMQAGFPITIPAVYSSGVNSYMWTPSNTLNCTDCPQPLAHPKLNTKYTVSFIDSNGCKNTGQTEIVVYCKAANVFIPNTFSPNADGSNDVFYVRGRGLDRVKSLRIFNRWGEVVFEKMNFPVNDASFGWDGKFRGNSPLPDVYVYQVEIFCDNSEVMRFDGNIALIK